MSGRKDERVADSKLEAGEHSFSSGVRDTEVELLQVAGVARFTVVHLQVTFP